MNLPTGTQILTVIAGIAWFAMGALGTHGLGSSGIEFEPPGQISGKHGSQLDQEMNYVKALDAALNKLRKEEELRESAIQKLNEREEGMGDNLVGWREGDEASRAKYLATIEKFIGRSDELSNKLPKERTELEGYSKTLLGWWTIAARIKPGENFTNHMGIEMVWLKDGDGGFWVGKYEVSMAQSQSLGRSTSDLPRTSITVGRANIYCNGLNSGVEDEIVTAEGEERSHPLGQYSLPDREDWIKYARGASKVGAIDRGEGPVPVSKTGLSRRDIGAYGLVGNVREWAANGHILGHDFRNKAPDTKTVEQLVIENEDSKREENFIGFRVIFTPPS